VVAQRRRAGREFRDERGPGADARGELAMPGRIYRIEPRAADRHGEPSGSERSFVSRGIDALGETAGDHEPRAREPGGEVARRVAARRSRMARADDGELPGAERRRIAEHVEHGRWVVDAREE